MAGTMDENWLLVQPEPFSIAGLRGWEGLFTQGSGYLHTRGSLEEHFTDVPQNLSYLRRPTNVTSEKFPEMKSKWGTFVPGVFGNHPLMGKEMANLPSFLEIIPVMDGERLDLERCDILSHQRTLNLHTAVLSRRITWKTKHGRQVEVTFERFASAARPHLYVQRMTLTSDHDADLTLQAGIDSDVRTSGYDHVTDARFERTAANQIQCDVTLDTGDRVQMLAWVSLAGAEWEYQDAGRAARLVGTLRLSGGQRVTFEKRTAVITSFDSERFDLNALLSLEIDYEALLAEHTAVWHERWENADVLIKGDARSQLGLRVALYHLMRAHPGHNRVAIDPKAYAGDAYRGLYFWDTEMYLLPFFLYTDPARGKMLTDFRILTLEGARRNASEYGYSGARYPWEGDTDGIDQCPNWQYRDHEVHVTADVVYGFAHYALAVDKPDYLSEAAEVLRETAAYWLERIDWRPGDGYPSLLGVMGPDEYAPITNNNAYTNRVVSLALRCAATIETDDTKRQEYEKAAQALFIPRRDDGLILQSEDFEQFAEIDFDVLWKDRSKTFASQVSQERLYRSRCLKQADVLLLMMLFPDEFSDQEVRAAWDYYVPYTTHDSSLSPGVHAIIALRLGLMEQAWAFWERSLHIDLEGGAEEGIHIAAQGINWQMAVFGFGGMRTAMQAEQLTLSPRLPEHWQKLAFPIIWKGQRVYVEVDQSGVTITNRSERDIPVNVYGADTLIPALGNTSFHRNL
jgi:trehalose/maltose hydrolase-like predicted phosphorylase